LVPPTHSKLNKKPQDHLEPFMEKMALKMLVMAVILFSQFSANWVLSFLAKLL